MYERAGSLTDILPPAVPASCFCVTTLLGCPKVLNALRSGPVMVSQASTLVGVTRLASPDYKVEIEATAVLP